MMGGMALRVWLFDFGTNPFRDSEAPTWEERMAARAQARTLICEVEEALREDA